LLTFATKYGKYKTTKRQQDTQRESRGKARDSIGRLGTIKNGGKLSEQAFENESILVPKTK